MNTKKILSIAAVSAVLSLFFIAGSLTSAQEKKMTKLAVVWTSGDPYVAHRVCFMYTHNAKRQGWFDEVELIVWGPSAKLLTEDESLQKAVKAMRDDGVIVEACIACANAYDIADDLRALDIPVRGMGKPLTDMLQSDWKVLTF